MSTSNENVGVSIQRFLHVKAIKFVFDLNFNMCVIVKVEYIKEVFRALISCIPYFDYRVQICCQKLSCHLSNSQFSYFKRCILSRDALFEKHGEQG